MKTAFIFPGQGSQQVGMGRSLVEAFASAASVFEEADRALEFSLSRLCFEGPEEALRLTANTQPAILTTSIAALRVAREKGLKADVVAGHSLGEYSALVAAGCLGFNDAVSIVRRRGEFMQEAVPEGEGAMAALLGCDASTVSALCRDASSRGVCEPANFNTPTQTVIAGHRAAVEHAVALAKERGVRKAVMLAVSAPFHCSLMEPAATRLGSVLDQIDFADLEIPLLTNVDAQVIHTGSEARDALVRQVASPVRWSQSVLAMIDQGVTTFVEVGPGKVLAGLIRNISRDTRVLSVGDEESVEAALAELA